MIWITGSQDVREAIDEIYAADDRAAAIVGASLLDTRIEAAIRARLIDDERSELLDGLVGERGPIGAFGTRIRLGFALGIYGPETKRDLLDIAKIRNAFAHEMAIKSFETEMKGVKQRCYDLRLIDRFV